jgi:hypothetical protein
MQSDPLLEKLDWVFTYASWTLFFPDTKNLFETALLYQLHDEATQS